MTQPKMFEEGTKEELIAHFKAASKAWEYIVQGKDAEIAKLRQNINALQADIAQVRKINKHDKVQELEYTIERLKDKIESIKEQAIDFAGSI